MRNDNEIGELLRACRIRAGLSHKELAMLLRVDRTVVVKIETGQTKRPAYTLVKEWARATKGEDLVGIDLTGGRDGWKRLTALESAARNAAEKVKAAMEALQFRKRKV